MTSRFIAALYVETDGAYEKARRIGMLAMVGGKDKTRIRNATPPEFRDVLIEIGRSAFGARSGGRRVA